MVSLRYKEEVESHTEPAPPAEEAAVERDTVTLEEYTQVSKRLYIDEGRDERSGRDSAVGSGGRDGLTGRRSGGSSATSVASRGDGDCASKESVPEGCAAKYCLPVAPEADKHELELPAKIVS